MTAVHFEGEINPSFEPVEPNVPTRIFEYDDNVLSVEEKLFEDQLIQEWLNQPDVYYAFAHKDIGNDVLSTSYMKLLSKQITLQEAIRTIPGFSVNVGIGVGIEVEGSVDVGGYLRESSALKLEKFNATRRQRNRDELLQNFDSLKTLAAKVRKEAFAQRDGEPVQYPGLLDVLADAKSFGQLPQALSPGAIRANHPDIANAFRRLGIGEVGNDSLHQLRSGDITINQYLNERNVTMVEFNQMMTEFSQINIELPEQTDIQTVTPNRPILIPDRFLYTPKEQLLRDRKQFFSDADKHLQAINNRLNALQGNMSDAAAAEREELEDKRWRIQRSVDNFKTDIVLQEHAENVAFAGDLINGAAALVSIFDPNLAGQFSQAAKGALQAYDAISKMMLTGTMTMGGVGAAAAGAMALMSAFDSSPTADEIILETLGKILENQRKILRKLAVIDHKIDVLQAHVDSLINIVTKSFDDIRDNQEVIINGIGDIRRDIREIEVSLRDDNQKSYAAPVFRKVKNIIDLFTNYQRFESAQAIRDYIEQDYTPPVPELFDSLQITLSDVSVFVTQQVTSDPFIKDIDLATMGRESVELLSLQPVEQRMGALPSMISWLHGKGYSRLSAKPFEGVGHPSYVSEFVTLYLEAAMMLPRQSRRDERVPRLANAIGRIRRAAKAMPVVLKPALSVYQQFAGAVHQFLDAYLKQMATTWPTNSEDTAILYGRSNPNDIKQILTNLPAAKLYDLAKRFGLVRMRSRSENRQDNGSTNYPRYCPSVEYNYVYDAVTVAVATDHQANKKVGLSGDLFIVGKRNTYATGHNGCPADGLAPDMPPATMGDPLPDADTIKNKTAKLIEVLCKSISDGHEKVLSKWQSLVTSNADLQSLLSEFSRSHFVLDTLIRGSYGGYVFEDNLSVLLNGYSESRLLKGADLALPVSLASLIQLRDQLKSLAENDSLLPKVPDDSVGDLGYNEHAMSKLRLAAYFDDLLPQGAPQ